MSSGAGSWAAGKLVAERHGTANLIHLFTDVKGNNASPHAGEDEDNYRFLEEGAANIGGQLVRLVEGRDIWQVFHDDRFLGNSRLANCSKLLKQRPARQWLEEHCNPATTVVYVGIDWTETHRLPDIERAYAHQLTGCVDRKTCTAENPCGRRLEVPWRVEAPLTEPPHLAKEDVAEWLDDEGIRPPRLYDLGFAHANCGGFCVRAGQGQFANLLEKMPERYAYHEAREEDLRVFLGKDIAVMNDRRGGGPRRPLTMRAFRERHQSAPEQTDREDIGGCGCFVADELPYEIEES